jgi:hypothetical protein
VLTPIFVKLLHGFVVIIAALVLAFLAIAIFNFPVRPAY